MRFGRLAVSLSVALLGVASACAPASTPEPSRPIQAAPLIDPAAPPGDRSPEASIPAPVAPEPPMALAPPQAELRAGASLAPDRDRIELPAGRSLINVSVPADRFVSIGVLGPTDALLGFDLIGPPAVGAIRSRSSLDEDGLLPRIVSFWTPPSVDLVTVLVDVAAPVSLVRVSAPASPEAPWLAPRPAGPSPKGKPRPALPSFPLSSAALKKLPPMPLVGLPIPASRDDGYVLQSPARYQFLRADVAHALLAAFRKVRVRFRRDPIAVADISQWDGLRPATDLGKPRHISHEGGRDVDLALPADDGNPSIVRAHCDGVLVEADAQGCAPGTVRGLDALRLAFLLGFLFDMDPPGRIERVFTDDAFIREIRRAALELRARRWIKDEAFEGLHNDEIMRPSPWHTDHVHIRFTGPAAVSRWPSGT
jgi:hypothetical protein